MMASPLVSFSQAQFLDCGTSDFDSTQAVYYQKSNTELVCTDPSVVKYLRVNVHFVLKDNGTGNFNEMNDGNGGSRSGYSFAEAMIKAANGELDVNYAQSNISPTPAVLPQKFRRVLMGVYFHRSTSWWNSNATSQTSVLQFNTQLGVNQTSEVNVFMTPLCCAGGIASSLNPGSGKFAIKSDMYGLYLQYPDWVKNIEAGHNLNHEMGHMFGLLHTFSEDGCDDTPLLGQWPGCNGSTIKDCWAYQPNPLLPCGISNPCNDWSKLSNNIMSYGQPYQSCYTPCQINKINDRLIGNTEYDAVNDYILACNGCLPPNAFFQMEQEHCIQGNIWMEATASFAENKWKLDICEVQGPNSTSCVAGTNSSTLWKASRLAKMNLKNYYTFQPNKWYKVTLTINNSTCNYPSTKTAFIHTFDGLGCTTKTPQDPISSVLLTQNPTINYSVLTYETHLPGLITVVLLDAQTGAIAYQYKNQEHRDEGSHEDVLETSTLQPGAYQLHIYFGGELTYKNLIKL